METYIALLRKEEGSSYGVDFPDFPGCITGGESMDVAYKRAPEALRFHIKGMLEDGKDIPEPTALDDILADPENAGSVPFDVSVPGAKTKRIYITISEIILQEVDAYARKHNMSRSAFLANAAKQAMKVG
jgi:predicted RNase H-like HicB family nuclease